MNKIRKDLVRFMSVGEILVNGELIKMLEEQAIQAVNFAAHSSGAFEELEESEKQIWQQFVRMICSIEKEKQIWQPLQTVAGQINFIKKR